METPQRHRFPCATSLALVALAGLLPLAAAVAQQSAAPAPATASHDSPRPDELEPGVNTTPVPPAAPVTASPESAAPAGVGASAPRSKRSGGSTAQQGTEASRAATAAAGPPATRKGADRLELDITEIKGNRELPKVLYIVPWKRSDLGDVVGKPVNSLLDEVLEPLDRDVFQRQNRYYDALKPDTAAPRAGAAQGSENKP